MMLSPPKDWCDMALLHGGVLAGGCLRDLITGRLPPKDVDIFVPGLLHEGDGKTYANGFRVIDVEKNGVTYQIIKHRFDGYNFLTEFDIGLCKVLFDPARGRWYFTEDFVKDVAQRKITVLNTHHFHHEKHLASVIARYPDYELVPYDNTFPF